MKRVAYSFAVAATAAMMSSTGFAADMAVKAPPAAAAPASPWDVVVTAAMMTDYNFRGVTQSNHRPSAQAGFELRYNVNPNFQLYAGTSGESISFPNDAAAEIDFYGGFRPTFDKLALDFGVWEYYYPGGECFGAAPPNPPAGAGVCSTPIYGAAVPNPNNIFSPTGGVTVKANESFTEVYGKATYTFNDNWAAGIQEWYSPSVLNTGAQGWYTVGNITYTAPSNTLPNGVGLYVSGDLGYWDLGHSDLFYGTNIAPPALGSQFETSVKYTSYWNWDAGIGFTWKVLTLDLRYYDTNLNKSQCEVFTSAQNGAFNPSFITAQNPSGLGTDWCSAWFVAKLSASVDFASNLK